MFSHTLVIIIVTAVISIVAFSNSRIYNDLIMYPPAIRRGQYYRLLTSGFIHADYMHLLFNMLTLWFFGKVLEQQYFIYFGKFTFVIFYLLAITVSDIPSYVKHQHNASYASLGASGGVSAILFAYIILAPWSTIYLFFLPVPAIVFGVVYLVYSQYMANRGGDNINHDAHFWGAVFGIAGVLVLDKEAIPRFIELIQHPQFNF